MHDRLPFARQILAQSTQDVQAAVASLTPAQWAYRPSSGGWTPLEIVEHLGVLEDFGLRNFDAQFPRGEAATPRAAEALVKYDHRLVPMVLDRSAKIEAPERVRPLGKLDTPDKAVGHFVALRAKTEAFAAAPTWDISTRTSPHPVFGQLDGVQWLILTGVHTQRHLAQIAEMRGAADWPA